MTPVMESLCGYVELVERVACRLEASGAVRELQQLAGLSAQEMDVLVRLERESL